jgi:hypothetical protein
MQGMPKVTVRPDAVPVRPGMDVTIAPMFAKPGTAALAYNYEYAVRGGADRVKGIEPFDGRPAPSAAVYQYLQCAATISNVIPGDTLTGATSGATGQVIYVSGAFVALTKVTGTFGLEVLNEGGTPRGTVTNLSPTVDGFLDNTLLKAAADVYQADIAKVPGSGPIRGLYVLNDVVYAWRNNVGATAMAIYKSTTSGWTLVPLLYELSFTVGATQPAEGSTLTQGGVTATVKRVVLQSGTFGAGTAAGRYIITVPSGGAFAAGALAGGAGTVPAAGPGVYIGTQIALSPGGSVDADVYSFTANQALKRLYGCDTVNREFEFDGEVLVPLETGMSSIRASVARCHKNHLFFGYRGSLQHSSIAAPYQWSPVTGAGELATGDEITNLISIGGASDAAALMVLCRNGIFVLYGTSALLWNLVPLSRVSGAQPRSAHDIGGVVALDTPGVMTYPASQNFGNFAWNTVSMQIQPLVREQECACSVYSPTEFKYRIFFTDGSVVSGLPMGENKFAWSVLDYNRNIVRAVNAEIAGVARTFYGDDQGWVYEADKGRSFAGDPIEYVIKFHPMNQRSPMVEKGYFQMQVEVTAKSAFTMLTSGEFNPNDGPTQQTETQSTAQYGSGLIWDLTNYDESYWDTAGASRKTVPMRGVGTGVAPSIGGESASELSHTIYALTVLYSPRRLTR